MRTLYPAIVPYVTHSLAVDDTHTLHIEECGNPHGIPALFIHGGPGGGTSGWQRRFFDPERYRIILFDQRGCGRSTPHASLENNTTWHLVEDMEAIRQHLKIEKWLLFGGSWGSTLALAYAQTHPDKVLAMVLRGIFLCRDEDIHWFYQEGASRIYPDYWEEYLKPIPPAKRDKMVEAFYEILTGNNELQRMAAAKAWSIWEGRTATLLPNHEVVDHFGDPYVALAMARIECHYFINHSFMRPNQLLEDMDRIRHIPAVIVHGRYDTVCPIDQAWALHERWHEATLRIVPDSGHSAAEPGIVDALIDATDMFAERLA